MRTEKVIEKLLEHLNWIDGEWIGSGSRELKSEIGCNFEIAIKSDALLLPISIHLSAIRRN